MRLGDEEKDKLKYMVRKKEKKSLWKKLVGLDEPPTRVNKLNVLSDKIK
jgi:hypothetical protein